MLHLRTARLGEPAALPLLAGLAAEYERTYGTRLTRGEMSAREASEFDPPRGALLLLLEGEETVAGAGLVPVGGAIAEFKRMWVAPAGRGRGHARLVLDALEWKAHQLGYRTAVGNTGARSTAALELYRSVGFRRTPPFGRYHDEPLAIGLWKQLDSPPAPSLEIRDGVGAVAHV
jgi:GNAT superfamily N-acetyltransferase